MTRRALSSLPAALLVLLLLAAPATADIFKPTRLDDPAPGKCKPDNCSLREAITKANKHDGIDKVILGKGTYELAIPENPADDNMGGDLDVTDEVKILGKGTKRTTVDGNGISGVFALLTFPPKTIERMTITGGNNPDVGGGIFSGPQRMTLRNVVVTGNSAVTGGGGIGTVSEHLLIIRTTISGNHAEVGGGLYVPAGFIGQPLGKVRESTLSGNTAAIGAGLYLNGDNSGGSNFDPSVDVVNSTFAGNQATVSGGGMSVILGSVLEADHTTVAFNAADSDNTEGGIGGGIHQSSGGSLEMNDSIVQGNTVGTSGDGPTCGGTFLLVNVIVTPQGGASCSFLGGSLTQGEAPPKLDPLADNGGPTQTIALQSGSAALGFAADCPKRDQRGVDRPPDGCDAGAYEGEGP